MKIAMFGGLLWEVCGNFKRKLPARGLTVRWYWWTELGRRRVRFVIGLFLVGVDGCPLLVQATASGELLADLRDVGRREFLVAVGRSEGCKIFRQDKPLVVVW